ncbi:hypothetical protein PM082_020059 [Marasmius tenuissimus]|nr:hypothetical protein PM082_020059 [Marasmius tenuissimus]
MGDAQTWTDRLPTLQRLGSTLSANLNVDETAQQWFTSFTNSIHDTQSTLDLLHEDAMWRDLLTFTWNMRTFVGKERIRQFLLDRVAGTTFTDFKLKQVQLQKPQPDIVWIMGVFQLKNDAGSSSGVFRLVPMPDGRWKAFTIFTTLNQLAASPYQIGALRRREPVPGVQWLNARHKEAQFEDQDPAVLIIGAGQSGLSLAARLKHLDVPTLLVERDGRIGDSWRKRYASLCLHFPVWSDHMPYLPFPPTWPVYTPSYKMADWLESYAKALELNVWTSSTVTYASQGNDKKWDVRVEKSDGSVRDFRVNHLVFAAGIGDGCPKTPDIPGLENFKGKVTHSVNYQDPNDFQKQKVAIIGTGNSGHDIASDLVRHGIDVTMIQRGKTFVMNMDAHWKFLGGALYNENGPPTELADLLFHSMPHLLQEGGLAQRASLAIMESQKDTVEKLQSVGFHVSRGLKDAGFLLQIKERGGGHCFDNGSIKLIIDGKIKVKSGSQIASFCDRGLEFADGSRVECDTVICATGVGDPRNLIRKVCGDEVADECPPLLGVNEEGEMNSYREMSRRGLWYMIGSIQMNRFHSNFLALQIKAAETNVITTRY